MQLTENTSQTYLMFKLGQLDIVVEYVHIQTSLLLVLIGLVLVWTIARK
jgi:hypothetical protein